VECDRGIEIAAHDNYDDTSHSRFEGEIPFSALSCIAVNPSLFLRPGTGLRRSGGSVAKMVGATKLFVNFSSFTNSSNVSSMNQSASYFIKPR